MLDGRELTFRPDVSLGKGARSGGKVENYVDPADSILLGNGHVWITDADGKVVRDFSTLRSKDVITDAKRDLDNGEQGFLQFMQWVLGSGGGP